MNIGNGSAPHLRGFNPNRPETSTQVSGTNQKPLPSTALWNQQASNLNDAGNAALNSDTLKGTTVNAERDTNTRELAYKISQTLDQQPFDVAVGAAIVFVVTQCDILNRADVNQVVSDKLREIADLLDPTAREPIPLTTTSH